MMPKSRREKIREKLDYQDSVTVSELVDEFDVSGATIRRDLEKLEEEGLIIRDYGGAVKADQGRGYEPPYSLKKDEHPDEKKRIGRVASSLVQDDETILLDSGSTTLEVAKSLDPDLSVTVVTNDLKVAMEMTKKPNLGLIVLGGKRREKVYTLQGGITERTVNQFTFDRTFLGAAGLDEEVITTADNQESFLKKQMIEAGQTVTAVLDRSKFNKRVFATVCEISAIDSVVTDESPPSNILESFDENGVEVITPSS